MSTLWDDTPSSLKSGGALDSLEPVLNGVDTPTQSERVEDDGFTWRVWTTTAGGQRPLSVDPANGTFSTGTAAARSTGTPLVFPDPRVGIEFALRLDGAGEPDGTVRLIVKTPKAFVRLPFLRGAFLDAQGQLRADANNQDVKFHLPAIDVQWLRPSGGSVDFELKSSTLEGHTPQDQIFDFISMEPPHALIGPGEVVGFAFRSATLDLTGEAGPSGVPANARTQPAEWQGLYLPEVRLFVAPTGMEGLACSAGVRDLWIGIGKHAGVTGLFEAEVVNRGTSPTVRLAFQGPAGEWYPVRDTDPILDPINLPDSATLYITVGGGLAPYRYEVRVDGADPTTLDRRTILLPDTGMMELSVKVRDAGSHDVIRTIQVTKAPPPAIPSAPPAGGLVDPTTTTSTGHRVVVTAQTATHATVGLSPQEAGDIAWSWSGGTATGSTATIPVGEGATVTVTATRTTTPATHPPVSAHMKFERPSPSQFPTPPGWELNPENLGAEPITGTVVPFLGGDAQRRLDQLPKDTPLVVEGFASFERDQPQINTPLSERRRAAFIRLLTEHLGFTAVTPGTAHGQGPAQASSNPRDAVWRRATATPTPAAPTTETITADLVRKPTTTPVDPEPTRTPVPDCFRKLGVRVELIRGTFVRAEVYGEFDVRTAAEARLEKHTDEELPARTNPSDGICTFLVRLRIAEDRSSWETSAEFRAIEGDLDGLAKVAKPAAAPSTGLNILGAVAALSPLLAAATPPSPTAGELVPMVVLAGGAVTLGATGRMEVQHVILRGGQLLVTDGLVNPVTGSGPTTTQVSVLLDVETAFSFDLTFIKVDPAKPIVTRYKAVGIRSSWDSQPQPDGTIEYVPLPVFDPSKGYTLDVPAGSLAAAPPLDSILRVLGVKVSRLNPTYLEVEVGLGVDLGIVSVDTARVRFRLDEAETPQLTKLGAGLDIPGAIHGTGYLEITDAGFKGAFDMTFPSVGLRAAAVLALESRDGTTGVLIGGEVELPVPLPLGNSGLAILGFLGGVGVNYRRKEPTGVQAAALKWLEGQLVPARGFNVMHPDGWELSAGTFAVAAGVMLGTTEGGFLVHLKGIVLVEVPGPRLLLIMKADVLKLPPALESQQSATFLAVVDLDFGRGTVTIGVVADYSVVDLIRIRVPVTAYFNLNQSRDWLIDLGTYDEPVSVTVLDVFKGTGYLRIHGDGTTLARPDLPVVTNGMAIAIGFHLQCVLMGSKSVGLYFEVAAGFHALISFEPFAIGGTIYARGELRLWIVSISASAKLTVLVGRQRVGDTEVERTYIHGEVCGKVSFFFFDVEGCIELTIGEEEPAGADRAPAGRGGQAGEPFPGAGRGDRRGPTRRRDPRGRGRRRRGRHPAHRPPRCGAGGAVRDDADCGTRRHRARRRAARRVRRGRGSMDPPRRQLVALRDHRGRPGRSLQPAPPAGRTPATWWARNRPGQSDLGPALALLSSLPTPAPRAVPYGESLETTISERWGHICSDIAPPAQVLWTFDGKPIGPSAIGWQLTGVVWPDPPGTFRSSPTPTGLQVTETWRTGHTLADALQGTDPAVVIGDAVACPIPRDRVVESVFDWADGTKDFSNAIVPTAGNSMQTLADLMVAGSSLPDLPAAWANSAFDPELAVKPLACEGRILRSSTDDFPEPAPFAPDEDRELVKQVWNDTGFTPSEFANTIRLSVDSGLEHLELLLLVSERMLNEGLVVTSFDRDGNVVAREPVTGANMVHSGNPLPLEYTDPNGPWADPIERAGVVAARVVTTEGDLLLARVKVPIPGDVPVVEVGAERRHEDVIGTPFYLDRRGRHRDGRASSLRLRHEGREDRARRAAVDPHPGPQRRGPARPGPGVRGEGLVAGRGQEAGAEASRDRDPRVATGRRRRRSGSPPTARTRRPRTSGRGCWPVPRRWTRPACCAVSLSGSRSRPRTSRRCSTPTARSSASASRPRPASIRNLRAADPPADRSPCPTRTPRRTRCT